MRKNVHRGFESLRLRHDRRIIFAVTHDRRTELAQDDPTLPPAGRRSGTGSHSVLPYLHKTLAARPQAKPSEYADSQPAREDKNQPR